MKTNISDFRSVIFDVDRTLINNRRLYRIMLLLLLSLGFGKEGGNLYLPTGAIPIPSWAEKLHQSPGLTRLALKIERLFAKVLEILDRRNPRLFEGAREVLDYLSQNRIKLFASTGGNTCPAIECLRKLSISDFFTLIIGADKIPKREHFRYFADYLGLSLEEFTDQAAIVSDGPVDLTLARKNGIYSVGITNTLRSPDLLRKYGADEVIFNLRELLA